MNGAAPSGDGMRSLRTAAALCLASPLAACVVLPDGRLHAFNEPYRVFLGAHGDLTSFITPWAPRRNARRSSQTQLGPDTVTLSFVPVREDETNVLSGVLVSIMKGADKHRCRAVGRIQVHVVTRSSVTPSHAAGDGAHPRARAQLSICRRTRRSFSLTSRRARTSWRIAWKRSFASSS